MGTMGEQKDAFRESILHFGVTFVAITAFALTAWFANLAVSVHSSILSNLGFSSTLTILRILQGVTSTTTTIAFSQLSDLLCWSLACLDKGVDMLLMVAISSTTDYLGLFKMIFGCLPPWTDGRSWIYRALAIVR